MYLQDIYTYPIKSLGGIRLDRSMLEEKGLQHDRRWMLVDQKGQFLSQRQYPGMALLQTRLSDEGVSVFQKHDPEKEIIIPYEPQSSSWRQVTIWEDRVEAGWWTGQSAAGFRISWKSTASWYLCRNPLIGS